MAKTKMTTSERSMKNCFIQVRGKASYDSSLGISNRSHKDAGGTVEFNIDATVSEAKNNFCQSPEISGFNVAGTRKKSCDDMNDTDDSDSSEMKNKENSLMEENEEESADDDKSDYGAESFCSDVSYKGSEVTNVTPRSSISGCSSLLQSAGGLKYDRRITDLMRSRRNGDPHRDDQVEGGSSFLLESEIKYLGEDTLVIDQRQLTRSGRRNMSFTNDELQKIERENQVLLRKIMSHQKSQGKNIKPISGPPRTSSSAINRKRQQKRIEEDNMMLLRRIQQAKPCAMPRNLAPGGGRLATM